MGAEEGTAEEEADGAAAADAAGPAQRASITFAGGVGPGRGDLDALLDHHLRVGGVEEVRAEPEQEDSKSFPACAVTDM